MIDSETVLKLKGVDSEDTIDAWSFISSTRYLAAFGSRNRGKPQYQLCMLVTNGTIQGELGRISIGFPIEVSVLSYHDRL